MWLAVCLLMAGCVIDNADTHAICVLVDVSGTYSDQKSDVVDIIKKGILPGLRPGDALILMRIDSKSFEKDNVVASIMLDARPSHANAQKMRFARELDTFAEREEHSRFTDVRGSMMLAADYLRESGAGTQMIIAFSDMQEDLPKGIRRSFSEQEFEDIHVVAVNVKKLDDDNADPTTYRQRIADWEEQILACGAREWRVIADGPRLVHYLDKLL
jgi:hypothetical protein